MPSRKARAAVKAAKSEVATGGPTATVVEGAAKRADDVNSAMIYGQGRGDEASKVAPEEPKTAKPQPIRGNTSKVTREEKPKHDDPTKAPGYNKDLPVNAVGAQTGMFGVRETGFTHPTGGKTQ